MPGIPGPCSRLFARFDRFTKYPAASCIKSSAIQRSWIGKYLNTWLDAHSQEQKHPVPWLGRDGLGIASPPMRSKCPSCSPHHVHVLFKGRFFFFFLLPFRRLRLLPNPPAPAPAPAPLRPPTALPGRLL